MIPVIFIHRGNSDIVHDAIAQAQRWNERVILLGDDDNITDTCEYYPHCLYYSAQAERLSRIYQHMHSNPGAEYRLANYLRWFIILQFMQTHKIARAFVADSDLLLYANVTIIAEDWGVNDVLLGAPWDQDNYRWAAPGHASYWTLAGLQRFCAFALQQYSTDTGLRRLQTKWNWHRDSGINGGICDMTVLYLFQQEYPKRVKSLLVVSDEGWHAFDLNVNYTENYLPDEYETQPIPIAYGRMKRITWIDDQPYGHSRYFNRSIRFDGLHFQSRAKEFLKDYLRI